MSANTPALPLELDPLIAEAKHRARRRRHLLATAGLVAVGSLTVTYVVRGSERPRPGLLATPACRPAELRAEKPRFGGVYTGHVVESLAFQNLSPATCALAGWPTVTTVLPDGRHVVARVGHVRNVGAAPRARVTLPAGGAASFHVIADDGTGDTACPFPLPSVRVLIVPPGAATSAHGATTMPYCHDPRRLLIALSPVVSGRLDRYAFQ